MGTQTVQCGLCGRILDRGSDESAEIIRRICTRCEEQTVLDIHRREPRGRSWFVRMILYFFGVRRQEGRDFSDAWWRNQERKDHENKRW